MTIAELIKKLHAIQSENCDIDLNIEPQELFNWVEPLVDAEDVPIHVGDKLTDGEYTFKVHHIDATFYDSQSVWSICNEDGIAWAACDVTHYHAPTIEDVLREFADKIADSQIPNVHPTYEEVIAEYTAKLCLIDEEKE